MQIKNVDNFNLQDCERFLNENPNSDLADAVRLRQRQLMDEIFRANERDEEARKAMINSCRKKMQWIDMALFNEKKKYKTYSTSICITLVILCACAFAICPVVYFCNTTHYMYEGNSDRQATHVIGLESILLNLDMIKAPVWWYDDGPHWDSYRAGDSCAVTSILGLVSFYCLVFLIRFHSPLIKKIYNIQDGDKSQKYRAIQNKQGKMGLCKVERYRIKKVLPFDYNDIFMICDNSYICKKGGKYGIYNTETNKMLVPIQYDDIYAITDDSIELVMNSQVHRFTHKGYRIVNQ